MAVRSPANPGIWLLSELARRFGGELVGKPETPILRVATLDSAGSGDIGFVSNPKYRSKLSITKASAVILPVAMRGATSLPYILCRNPYLFFARVANLFSPPGLVTPGIHPTAVIESDAKVAKSAEIGPFVYIGHDVRIGKDVCVGAGSTISAGARIGDGSRLFPRVVIYAGCTLGRRVIVHSGAIIGADGFGIADEGGKWLKIPQTGRVVIGDDVEIGANCTIDRGALDDTVIEDGVKLDNQIQIGHNVRIGAHSALAGCVGIAGSATVGRHCTIGGGAILVGHIHLADNVHISAATLVTKSIPAAGTYTGAFPFMEHDRWAKTAVRIRNIDSDRL